MNPIDIANRFTDHELTGKQQSMSMRHTLKAREFAELINGQCPDNREKSIAMTKIEEALMWANKSLEMRKEEDVEW